jgi:hypothetical protein
MLETYLKKFANLRTDRGHSRYPAFTLHRAPHKPFLMLSVMDLITSGLISENCIEPSFELVDTFTHYWPQIMPTGSRTKWISDRPLPLNTTNNYDSRAVTLYRIRESGLSG